MLPGIVISFIFIMCPLNPSTCLPAGRQGGVSGARSGQTENALFSKIEGRKMFCKKKDLYFDGEAPLEDVSHSFFYKIVDF